eukprot:Nitzschia sp. Nitz4//scaffold387_size12074//10400//11402//NITZ4_009003-RA/size12074-augustus-gene-0.8-mRNA-1//1//CDS//3329549976//3340//frame0
MLTPTLTMNQQVVDNHGLNGKLSLESPKRGRDNLDEVDRSNPTKKRRMRKISWDDRSEIHLQTNRHKEFKDYNEGEIWYTRNEYEDFLLDRLRTVQCLRASGGNEKALNSDYYCLRGLEPFQTVSSTDELHSQRRFHQSTIMIEQIRQTTLGLRDPERFRVMVGPQSEMALRRAQELAALDEHEVYGRVCRRRSLLTAPTTPSTSMEECYKATKQVSAQSPKNDQPAMPLSDRVRKLQEWNAQRLADIYSQPGNKPFRFPVRRDSLVGNTSATRQMLRNTMVMSNRFPIRRDSLIASGSGDSSRL